VTTPIFMRNAEGYADNGKRSAAFVCRMTLHCVSLSRNGLNANRRLQPKKYSGSRYYPEIASFSPQFVGTTFYSSHTMMEAGKQGGLIASSEARIVDSRHASNRLSEETQSAARRRKKTATTDKREKVRDERFGRSAMSPATTGGWIANFVGHG